MKSFFKYLESRQASSMEEFRDNEKKRRELISLNRSRRLRNEPPLPVPEKLSKPLVPVAYEADGTYAGKISPDEVERYKSQGYKVKWEEEI